jgi:hypothetical protein
MVWSKSGGIPPVQKSAYDQNYDLKKTGDFQLFSCRLGIELISGDGDLGLKKLGIWGFGAKNGGDLVPPCHRH